MSAKRTELMSLPRVVLHPKAENAESSGSGASEMQEGDLATAARKAIELRLGRPLTNVDWCRMRKRLVEFAMILYDWDRELEIDGGREDRVVEMRNDCAKPTRQAA